MPARIGVLLTGFMFPFEGMPRAAQFIGNLLPLTHFVRLFRGILLRAAILGGMKHKIPPLLAFMAVTLGLAVLRFRKRLD